MLFVLGRELYYDRASEQKPLLSVCTGGSYVESDMWLFFLVVPTTNVRPHLQSTDIFAFLLKMVYVTDAPTRLFPSIHCLVSWFCYIGLRGQKSIPKWYQTVSLIFAILVCVSTQVTKQHYVIDVLGGIAIAEFCYWISGKIMKRLSSRKEEEIVK